MILVRLPGRSIAKQKHLRDIFYDGGSHDTAGGQRCTGINIGWGGEVRVQQRLGRSTKSTCSLDTIHAINYMHARPNIRVTQHVLVRSSRSQQGVKVSTSCFATNEGNGEARSFCTNSGGFFRARYNYAGVHQPRRCPLAIDFICMGPYGEDYLGTISIEQIEPRARGVYLVKSVPNYW